MKINAGDIQMLTIDDESPDVDYLNQDGWEDRRGQYIRGEFYFIGVRAHLEIMAGHTRHTFQSGGMWGIESDSDEDYLEEVFQEEKSTLIDDLKTMGFTVENV